MMMHGLVNPKFKGNSTFSDDKLQKNFLSYTQAHMAHCSALTHGHLVSLFAMKDAYLQFSFIAVVPLHTTLIFFLPIPYSQCYNFYTCIFSQCHHSIFLRFLHYISVVEKFSTNTLNLLPSHKSDVFIFQPYKSVFPHTLQNQANCYMSTTQSNVYRV